jgi:acetyl-CoA carboxylase carboxyltransferase component
MASDPFFYGGAWTADACDKIIRFVDRAEIEMAPDPAAKRAEIEARLEQLRSPFRTAEPFWIEELIDPRDTRRLTVEFAKLADKLREPGERRFCMRP